MKSIVALLIWDCYRMFQLVMCGSRKYPYPQHRDSLVFPRRRGLLKAKIFKGMYEPKLEFPEEGCKPKKNLRGGSMDIFWNNTMCT